MGSNPPNEKIFLGDIPLGADEAFVTSVFKVYGNVVDCKVLPARVPGQKGAALVRFETLEEASWIVENLNGNIPQGMSEPVFVQFAKPQGGKGGGGGGFGPARNDWGQAAQSPYGGGGMPGASDKIFVGDIPQHYDENAIRALFGQYGSVVDCKLLPPRTQGEKGAALVRFASHAEAKGVVDTLNGTIPPGLMEPLYITFSKSQSSPGNWVPPAGGAPATTSGRPMFSLGGMGGGRATMGAVGQKGGGGFGGSGQAPASSCDITTVVRMINKSNLLPGAGEKPDANTIYIKGVPRDTTDLDLYKIFAPFGAIAVNGVKAMLDGDGSCKGVGFVDYVDPGSAQMAIATLNGCQMPDGAHLLVEVRPPSKPREGGKGMSFH